MFGGGLLGVLVMGCGTMRMTDTQRTATEQLLISSAVDQAVSQIDFRTLAGKPVYFDPQYLDCVIDRGYVISSLRQRLLAEGCILQEDRQKATYIIEARSGGVGTDHYSVLIGVPQISLPSLTPGIPVSIPELPLAKKSDEQGVAKIAVFAYNRLTGQRVWQSGAVEASTSAEDTWVAGLGPFRHGTLSHGMEFAGEEVHLTPPHHEEAQERLPSAESTPVTVAALWPEPATGLRNGSSLFAVLVKGLLTGSTRVWTVGVALKPKSTTNAVAGGKSPGTDSHAGAAPPLPPVPPNLGGQGETVPSKVLVSGMRMLPES
jgi:hypothetical protein